jgi:hypothetical protein
MLGMCPECVTTSHFVFKPRGSRSSFHRLVRITWDKTDGRLGPSPNRERMGAQPLLRLPNVNQCPDNTDREGGSPFVFLNRDYTLSSYWYQFIRAMHTHV